MLAEGAEHKNHASARLPAHAARRQAVRRRGRGRDGAEERSRAPPQVGSQIVLDEPEVDGRNVVRSHRGERTTARAPDLAAALLRMRAPGASVRKGAWTCPPFTGAKNKKERAHVTAKWQPRSIRPVRRRRGRRTPCSPPVYILWHAGRAPYLPGPRLCACSSCGPAGGEGLGAELQPTGRESGEPPKANRAQVGICRHKCAPCYPIVR